MRYLFTTSSDISDGVILTFDMKTREIRIGCHQRREPEFTTLEWSVDDLVDEKSRPAIQTAVFSQITFQSDTFRHILRKLDEFVDSGRAALHGDNTLALEVNVADYATIITGSTDFTTMTRSEFANVLIGYLNDIQFARFRGQLLKQEKEKLEDEIIAPIFHFECDRCGMPTHFAAPDENGKFAGVCQTCGEKLCARCAGGWIDEICERCRSGETKSP